MPRRGLEPPHLTAPEPKSGVSTNSTTWAGDLRESLYLFLAVFVNRLSFYFFSIYKKIMGKDEILIVGAGPVGLTMACELARHGAKLRVIDKNPRIHLPML
jgi:hypothetical protein